MRLVKSWCPGQRSLPRTNRFALATSCTLDSAWQAQTGPGNWTLTPLISVLVFSFLINQAASAASSARPLVGHIMALLAVFEQADALPPESSPEANQLIHALIQTQAALTKSTDPATRRWFSEALLRGTQRGGIPIPSDALTSHALEAILTYAATHRPVDEPAVLAGLKAFNIGESDFTLMARVYQQEKSRLSAAGQDLHSVYEKERQKIPLQ